MPIGPTNPVRLQKLGFQLGTGGSTIPLDRVEKMFEYYARHFKTSSSSPTEPINSGQGYASHLKQISAERDLDKMLEYPLQYREIKPKQEKEYKQVLESTEQAIAKLKIADGSNQQNIDEIERTIDQGLETLREITELSLFEKSKTQEVFVQTINKDSQTDEPKQYES